MSIYAIGDIQGCFDELLKLLEILSYEPDKDQLWFVGDLVNRGPKSLETLRFVKSLGNGAVTVLGNHDLHLLAASCSAEATTRKDTINQVLEAPDRDELIDWLRHCPMFHHNGIFSMVHAGLPPQWDFKTTQEMAVLVERALRGTDYHVFLQQMYGNEPNLWSNELTGIDRLRFAVNCFTRIRYCDREGRLDFEQKGPPGTQPELLMPWFQVPNRKNADMRIVCGHWSALGYYEARNCIAIDTGCLWGGQLTAVELGDELKRFSVDCAGL